MTDLSWAEIKQQVHQRAILCCEDCQTSQKAMGQAISAEDSDSGNELSLINPREQVWEDHFNWYEGGKIIVGRTATGRATVARLKMNQLRIVEARAIWILAGIHPPS